MAVATLWFLIFVGGDLPVQLATFKNAEGCQAARERFAAARILPTETDHGYRERARSTALHRTICVEGAR